MEGGDEGVYPNMTMFGADDGILLSGPCFCFLLLGAFSFPSPKSAWGVGCGWGNPYLCCAAVPSRGAVLGAAKGRVDVAFPGLALNAHFLAARASFARGRALHCFDGGCSKLGSAMWICVMRWAEGSKRHK